MDALKASYGDSSSGSDSETDAADPLPTWTSNSSSDSTSQSLQPLPPPPVALLQTPNSIGAFDILQGGQVSRVRSFPHVEGNYALHVYIPVNIKPAARKDLVPVLRKVTALVPDLCVVDVDIALCNLLKDDHRIEQVALGREFHISLGRTVPIRVHQINSVVSMLRQKLQSQRQFLIDFNKWEVFVNDDHSRTFLSLEAVEKGLLEIEKLIHAVDEVYKLHNLPEFYKDPRPHISVAWALGDVSDLLKRVLEEETKRYVISQNLSSKRIFSCLFNGILCKIGQKTYDICKVQC